MARTISTTVILLMFFNTTGCAYSTTPPPSYGPNDELVVLAHGLGRSDWAMWKFAQRLKKANYKVCLLDYATIGESVASVLTQTTKQINGCVINAPKVHFVGHSLGGLVIRAYLQNHLHKLDKALLGEVVLIGTPNKGSELADHFKGTWLMNKAGGVTRALITGTSSLGNNLNDVDVELVSGIGVIAGTQSFSLTRDKFTGPNDGLVSVESTKLPQMTDFIAIEVSHSQMRYSAEVAEQTIHFLQTGLFRH